MRFDYGGHQCEAMTVSGMRCRNGAWRSIKGRLLCTQHSRLQNTPLMPVEECRAEDAKTEAANAEHRQLVEKIVRARRERARRLADRRT